jgi:hypothetical protein
MTKTLFTAGSKFRSPGTICSSFYKRFEGRCQVNFTVLLLPVCMDTHTLQSLLLDFSSISGRWQIHTKTKPYIWLYNMSNNFNHASLGTDNVVTTTLYAGCTPVVSEGNLANFLWSTGLAWKQTTKFLTNKNCFVT